MAVIVSLLLIGIISLAYALRSNGFLPFRILNAFGGFLFIVLALQAFINMKADNP